jgi:Ca2+-binding RTX toxin-like protein
VFVTGTNGNDVIRVWRSRNHRMSVTVNSPIALGTGCVLVDAVVTCTADSINIDGGAGNDALTVDGSARSTINGNSGNDVMVGGRAADVFIGGDGLDTVDYSARTERIVGTPGTGADDGRSREHDDIRGDVEQVVLPAGRR